MAVRLWPIGYNVPNPHISGTGRPGRCPAVEEASPVFSVISVNRSGPGRRQGSSGRDVLIRHVLRCKWRLRHGIRWRAAVLIWLHQAPASPPDDAAPDGAWESSSARVLKGGAPPVLHTAHKAVYVFSAGGMALSRCGPGRAAGGDASARACAPPVRFPRPCAAPTGRQTDRARVGGAGFPAGAGSQSAVWLYPIPTWVHSAAKMFTGNRRCSARPL